MLTPLIGPDTGLPNVEPFHSFNKFGLPAGYNSWCMIYKKKQASPVEAVCLHHGDRHACTDDECTNIYVTNMSAGYLVSSLQVTELIGCPGRALDDWDVGCDRLA